MDKMKIFSIFLTVIMLGSLFATALYFGTGSGSGDRLLDGDPYNQPTLNKELKNFKASGTQGKVSQIVPALVIQGQTEEDQVGSIDFEISKLLSFREMLYSEFISQEPTVYFGFVRLTTEDAVEPSLQELSDLTEGLLTERTYFKYGVVDLDEPLLFEEIDSDNKINQPVLQVEAFITTETQAGDTIELSCDAVIDLNTNIIERIICTQTSRHQDNSGFQIVNFKSTATIKDLNNTITFSHRIDYTSTLDVNGLKEDLETITGVTGVEYINYTPPNPNLSINAIVDTNELKDTLNKSLADSYPGLELLTSSYAGTNYSATLDVSNVSDINASKNEIENLLLSLDLEHNISEQNFETELNAYVHYASENELTQLAQTITQKLIQYDIESNLARIAYADLPSQVSQGEQTFFIPNHTNIGMVVDLSRTLDQDINVTFIGIASGDSITSLALVKDSLFDKEVE